MADKRKGGVFGGSSSSRLSDVTQNTILTNGDDTDSDDPLLDISETGFDKRTTANNRQVNCVSHKMEHETHEGSSSCEADRLLQIDLSNSLEPHHNHTQPEEHKDSNYLHTSNSSNVISSIYHQQSRLNPFVSPGRDLWQSINHTADVHNSSNERENDQTPNTNVVDIYDPLNFGDPTFVNTYSTPPTISSSLVQNPILSTIPRNTSEKVGVILPHPVTKFLANLSARSVITTSGSALPYRITVTSAATGHLSDTNQSTLHSVNPDLAGFERKPESDNQFITTSQTTQHDPQIQYNNSFPTLHKSVIPAENQINYSDFNDYKNIDLIIKDYTTSVISSRDNNLQFNHFAINTSPKETPDKGIDKSGFDKNRLLINRDNLGPERYKRVNHSSLEDSNIIAEHSGNLRETKDAKDDERSDSQLRIVASNSDNRFVNVDSSLNSSPPEQVDSFVRGRHRRGVYADNMHGVRLHWEEASDDMGLEEAPLLEPGGKRDSGAGTTSKTVCVKSGLAYDSSQRVPQGGNQTGVTAHSDKVLGYQVSSNQRLAYVDSRTLGYSEQTSLKETEHKYNNTRCAIGDVPAVRHCAAHHENHFIERNSYGEFNPVPHFFENGGTGHAGRDTSLRHCHKRRMTSLTDKLARRQLICVLILCLIFMIGEAVGGVLANSLALFTDVLHLGSDLISFVISLLAMWLANKPPTRRMSFGYHRAEVLGALLSVFIIWLISGVLCYIAVERIMHEHYKDVKPDEMLITASLGVLFNIVMGLVLHSEMCCGHAHSHSKFGHGHSHGEHGHSHSHGKDDLLDVAHDGRRRETVPSPRREGFDYQRLDHAEDNSPSDRQMTDVNSMVMRSVAEESHSEENHACAEEEEHIHKQKNINVRAAFIHVVGDIIQSLGVLIAAIIIKFTTDDKYRLADPICTFLFSILVLITTITVLRDTLLVVMEGVPREISIEALRKELAALDGVVTVHSLHIWALTLDRNALSVHLAIENALIHDQILSTATKLIQDKHHFFHSTIQVELYDELVMKNCKECLEWS